MKKQILLLLTVSVALAARATVPQLLGCTANGGANNAGSIVLYTGGSTSLSSENSFPANSNNFGSQNVGLTEGLSGIFYGMGDKDGASGLGSIFEYDYATYTYSVKVSLDSATGTHPYGVLLKASNGTLYGLTEQGDSTNGGTLFSYTPGGTSVTKLVTFSSSGHPNGTLAQAANGKLYGLTQYDGMNSAGSIFQYDITGAGYLLLYSLPSGAHPTGRLLEAGADTLYGLTAYDGTNHGGTLFRYVIASNSYLVLSNLPASANPSSELTRASNGKLYGLTNGDGAYQKGTMFSFDIDSGSYSDLHDFQGVPDGANPGGGLMQASDGMLYGTTTYGGANGVGSIFQYDISTGTYTKEVDLAAGTGSDPGFGRLVEYLPSTAVADVKDYNFSLYPNPTSGKFTLTYNYSGTLKGKLMNLMGEEVKELRITGNNCQFEMSELPSGIYQLQLADNSGSAVTTLKIVKE